jgi:DNA-directed RNA polymerase specialized sigma54-like protein
VVTIVSSGRILRQGINTEAEPPGCGGGHRHAIDDRRVCDKYVHTPQDLRPVLSTVSVTGGEHVASEAVKDKIRKVILSENSRRPLSDQKIVEILKQNNIEIAAAVTSTGT